MEGSKGKEWLMRYKDRQLLYQLIAKILYALGSALLLAFLVGFVYAMSWWSILGISVLFSVFYVVFSGIAKVSLLETAFEMDAEFPELEYSSSLFLKPISSLGTLQRIQLKKVEERLPKSSHRLGDVYQFLRAPLLFSMLSIALYATGYYFQGTSKNTLTDVGKRTPDEQKRVMPAPAAFTNAELLIHFPAYTQLPNHQQHDLSISALKGSSIKLRLHSNSPMKQVQLLFNGQRAWPMKKTDSLVWESVFPIEESGFYQIQYDGKTSTMYPLEVIPDQPVSIRVLHPDPHTTIEPGYPPVIALEAHLSDDYGIKNAAIVTTTSSGKGESVRFTSKEMMLKGAGGKTLDVKQSIHLPSLDMKPGDELFFYIRAIDVGGQESRSDMYIVAWQDTTELMSLSGIVSGSDVEPEYFRSQRQIIIDMEKLMAETPKLTKEEGQNRSNNIGIDQKLLRLRYGQFLGEETEEDGGSGHDHHDHEGEVHAESVPEDIEVLQDQLTHHHDRAEDATFFTPDQKAQLKATLTEMWNSELKLRTFQPQQALPYAYKALKLLKDLQQQSRTYVGKAPSKPTPLKPEKRLSGDLEDIVEPIVNKGLPAKDDGALAVERLRRTLAYLSNLQQNGRLDKEGLQLMTNIQGDLIAGATMAPGKYLKALKTLREMEESGGVYTQTAVQVLSTAVQELLPAQHYQPAVKRNTQRESIYNSYLNLIGNK